MSLALLEYDTSVQEIIFDVEELIERFIASMDVKINSKNTYRRQIKPFICWMMERYSYDSLRQINQQDIYSYKDSLVRAGKSAYTISGYLTAVRKFFEWLESNKIFPNIAKSVKGLKNQKALEKIVLL